MSAIFFNNALLMPIQKDITLINKDPISGIDNEDIVTPIYDTGFSKTVFNPEPVNDYTPYPGKVNDPLNPTYPVNPDYTEDVSEHIYGGTTYLPGHEGQEDIDMIEPGKPTMAGMDPKILLIGAGALVVGYLLYKIL